MSFQMEVSERTGQEKKKKDCSLCLGLGDCSLLLLGRNCCLASLPSVLARSRNLMF